MTWQIAVSTGAFYTLPILNVLAPIRRAGFTHVEICSHKAHLECADSEAVRRVKQTLDRLGLDVCSLHAPFGPSIDIAAPDEALRVASVAETFSAAQALRTLEGRVLVVHPGGETPPDEKDRPRLLERALESLRMIQARCADLGLSMAVEDMLPHLLGGRTEEILWLAESLPIDSVGFCLDTGHAQLGRSLEERLTAFGPRLILVHASDSNGEHDDHLPPGQGLIDWPGCVSSLARGRFDGALVLETTAPGAVADHLKELTDSMRLVAPPSA